MHFNLADIFESLVDAVPDNVALVSAPHRLTYRELDQRSNQVAHALASRGVGAGDHVGLFLYNGAEFIEAMIGCFKLRAVPININYRYVEDELAYLLDNADIVALLYQRELEPRVLNVLDKTPTVKHLVVVEDDSPATPSRATPWAELVAGQPTTRGFGPRSPDDLYVIYTGGTTGMPRGVMWRHEDVFFAGLQGGNPGGPALTRAEEVAELAPGRDLPMVILPAAPFIHGAAQWAAWIAIMTGGKVVLSPGKSFDPVNAVQLVEAEEVQVLNLVGDAMARPLAAAIRDAARPLPSLMVVSSAGAILSASVKAEIAELCPDAMVLNSFGASETGHQGTIYPGMDAPGKLTFYMDESNTVLGDDGQPVAPGSGVIGKLARSGHIPVGYYKDPVKTAATFLEVDGRRWVVPGDLATIEEDGRISVFGRGAVCINSGGEKVFPEEVEEALKAHPEIVDAVVVGVPDERWGQRVAAVVQCKPGVALSLADVDAHCRTKVAGYKVPREVHLVREVSRHPSGKPDYRWAKDVATGQQRA
ncbi:MAG: acyl-CoA synthetase [Polyangiaceae bacterium]|nr:acyl-CoA synthetase [Polyangiaceae bacterium]